MRANSRDWGAAERPVKDDAEQLAEHEQQLGEQLPAPPSPEGAEPEKLEPVADIHSSPSPAANAPRDAMSVPAVELVFSAANDVTFVPQVHVEAEMLNVVPSVGVCEMLFGM